ncbi:hypothetical protein [Chitinimonas lacunae]|uniref:Uncharacterized protein n=1 Tax=Chitinimonas lacunae TaxID=1963018 RepID=A0ABV8MKC8_9NEIS
MSSPNPNIDPAKGRPCGDDPLNPDAGWHDKTPGGVPVRFWMKEVNRRVYNYAPDDLPEVMIGRPLN